MLPGVVTRGLMLMKCNECGMAKGGEIDGSWFFCFYVLGGE